MKKLLITIIILITVICSCNEEKPETVVRKDSTELMTYKIDTAVTVRKELTTGSGRKFIIIETKPSLSVSNFMITGEGFKNDTDTIKYAQKNPMTTAMLSDLDKNGYQELYIITRSSGDEEFIEILALSSVNDTTFNEINIPVMTAEDVEKDEKFSGYLGHDSVYISDNKIIREFPIYKIITHDPELTDGRRKIYYSLKPVKGSYELSISGFEDFK